MLGKNVITMPLFVKDEITHFVKPERLKANKEKPVEKLGKCVCI